MTEQDLRDPTGKLIGKIKKAGERFELRGVTGKLMGRYDPKTNETRSDTGKLIGKGNLLTMLL